MFRFSIIILVIVAALVGFVVAKQLHSPNPQPDVCSELRQIELATDQVAKFNHRLRLRHPELQRDRDSNGATLELVSVYSKIFDTERKFGCR
jgi:hypothetical protein